MSILIVAQLKFRDRERYNRYQSRFADIFRKFRGRLVAADEHPTVLEGQDGPDKIVILEFPMRSRRSNFTIRRSIRKSRLIERLARTPLCSSAGVFGEELRNPHA
jgi:uncharacterized protein (DUF1330 family)